MILLEENGSKDYMRSMKRGFTLIELLAVIVILAVIALILTPVIQDIIKNAKSSADLRSAEAYVSAANNFYTTTLLNSTNKALIGTNVFDKIEVSGAKAQSGVIKVDNSGNVYMAIVLNNKCYTKSFTDTVASITVSTNTSNCGIYMDSTLNGADPDLVDGMIPVVIADDGTVTKADVSNAWYDYTNKRWANMVLVSSTSRTGYQSAYEGTTINQADILGYFVWIPRYRYQLFNVAGNSISPNEIQIVFENKNTAKSTGATNGSWLTETAFTFGTEELNGIWVGKYETTGTATTPTVLPNVSSLKTQNVRNEFATSLLFSNRTMNTDGSITSLGTNTTYGITGIDSHMAKNSEWSTVAYLTNSKYGRCTGGVCTEASINNSSSYITGSSAGRPGDTTTNGSTVYAYNTAQGYLATTTGNISGIYDMSGGAWEYVMGDLLDTNNKPYSGADSSFNSGFNGTLSAGGSVTTDYNFPDNKYYESYGSAELTGCNGGVCIGDSISETRGWYGDYPYYVSASDPWFARGGYYNDGAGAGVFALGNGAGGADSVSFRAVLTY